MNAMSLPDYDTYKLASPYDVAPLDAEEIREAILKRAREEKSTEARQKFMAFVLGDSLDEAFYEYVKVADESDLYTIAEELGL